MSRVRFVQSVIGLVAVSGFGYVLSFAKNLIIAGFFGAGKETDALFVAMSLPEMMFFAVNGAVYLSVVTLYNREVEAGRAGEASRLAGAALNLVLVGGAVLSAAVFVWAPVIVGIMAPGFPPGTRDLTITLVRLTSFSFAFVGAWSTVSALANARERFVVPGLIHNVPNIVIVGGLVVFSSSWGISVAAGGYTLGYAAAVLLLVVWAVRHGEARLDLRVGLSPAVLRPVVALSIPFVTASLLNKLMLAVSRFYASFLPEGSVSILTFAYIPVNFAHNILTMSFLTVLFARLTMIAGKGDGDDMNRLVDRAARYIALLMIPAGVFLAVLAEPVIRLVFERGAFGAEAAGTSARTLVFYAPVLVALGWLSLLLRASFARGEVYLYLKSMVAAFLVNAGLGAVLGPRMGVNGIALALVLATFVGVGFLYRWMPGGRDLSRGRREAAFLARITGIAVASGGAVWAVRKGLAAFLSGPGGDLASLILAGVVGVVAYWFLLGIVNVAERREMAEMVKSSAKDRLGAGAVRTVDSGESV